MLVEQIVLFSLLQQSTIKLKQASSQMYINLDFKFKFAYSLTTRNYSGDLNTELVWYSNGWKEFGCQWSGFRTPFEYQTNGCHLVHMCWSGIWMIDLAHNVKADHLKSKLQKVWYSIVSSIENSLYSDPHCDLFSYFAIP